MKVLQIAGILFLLYIRQTYGGHIVYDFTNQLSAIRAGNLSHEEFTANVKSYFGNPPSNLQFGLYTPDCNIIWKCENQINDAIQIIHDVNKELLAQKLGIRFFNVQLRVDIKDLKSLNTSMNQSKFNISSDDYMAYFLYLTLPDKTTCDELQNVTKEQWENMLSYLTWFSTDSYSNITIGFGYNEELIGCPSLYQNIQNFEFLLTTFSLGRTPGFAKSFELFKKRINYLHAQNIEFVKNALHAKKLEAYQKNLKDSPKSFEFIKNSLPADSNFKRPLIDYYTTPESVGDEYHRHLLNEYWKAYLTGSSEKINGIVPIPFGYSETADASNSTVIPNIDAASCDGQDSIPWFAPAALYTLNNIFGSAVLTHAEWKTLKSNASKNYYELYGSTKHNVSDIRLDIIIDYTDWLQSKLKRPTFSGCNYSWVKIERELKELNDFTSHPLQNLKVKALIFSLTNETGKNYTVNVSSDFAIRMSARQQIGCGFEPNSFSGLNNIHASSISAACRQVSGTFYTLQHFLKIGSVTNVSKESSQYFENEIRLQLQEMKEFRDKIIVLHPKATVYFQLRFELQIIDNHATAFCNGEMLSLNEYIEAIVNWAVRHRIPLIIGRAFDDFNHRKIPTWFSVLRQMSPSYRNWNPYFMIRNSPQIFEHEDAAPCVEWTIERPTITETFFHNNYLGAMLDISIMRENKPVSEKEMIILLRFTLHRFDHIEVFLDRNSYRFFINALNKLALDGLIGPRKRFLIYFTMKRGESDSFKILNELINLASKTLATNSAIIKGISFPFYFETSSSGEEDFNATTHRNSLAIELGRSSNFNMGTWMTLLDCEKAHQISVLPNEFRDKMVALFNTSGFLICFDIIDLNKFNNPKSLGELFDRHLYVKKSYQDLNPNLDLYFQVMVSGTITETAFQNYLILISHFKQLAAICNLSYLIVQTFDEEGSDQLGWWTISNYSNLSEISVYEERYSAIGGFETWRPSLHSKHATNNETTKNIVIASGFILMVVIFGVILWWYKNKRVRFLSNEDEYEFRNGRQGNGEEQTSCSSEYLKFDQKYELTFASIFIDPKDLLGRGNFGTVYKGVVNEVPVAIKRPNENCPATSFKSVLSEVKVLCYIGSHSNVVGFIGAYTKEIRKGILYIATELCSNGSLIDWLQAKKRVTSNSGATATEITTMEDEDAVHTHDLHRCSKEIAEGMEYIAGKNVIHGDLSARNVLLDENFTCKIGDFGLSRKLYEYLEYVKQSQEPLPWKWMAYESLKNMQFTSKSDVWSYGVTLWEIYSLGSVPYGGLSWTPGFADDLKNGLRLQKPEFATEQIYNTMSKCWNLETEERPTFTDIIEVFTQQSSCQYIVLGD